MNKLHIIESGMFKLDGGAMFGVVPKQLWHKLNPADENNMCTWAMRCLLVETETRLILIDTGMDDKQDDRFMSHFEPHGEENISSSLGGLGFKTNDITDVFLTHFHFDHVGGALIYDDNKNLIPAFPKATYWSTKSHYHWALIPNNREKASFLKENFVPLMDHGVLRFIDEIPNVDWLDGIKVQFYYGHTHSMMLPIIPFGIDKKLVYCADLIPSSYHARLPYIMAYDIRPLKTLSEKIDFYKEALDQDYYLFFEHDPEHCLGKLMINEKGKYSINVLPFHEEILN